MSPAFRTPILLLTFLVPFFLITSVGAEEKKESNTLKAIIEAGGAYIGVDACKECHDDHIKQISQTKHGQKADARTPFGEQGCESCHGPGESHIREPDKGGLIIAFRGKNPSPLDVQNGICLQCHQESGITLNWHASSHEGEDLACVSCHEVHKPGRVMERITQSEVCYECHQNIRAQTFQASTHPIRENKVVCSDCHDPHGSQGPAELKQYTINANCYSCHAEKRGPFLWEHYPVVEDCTTCHRVHGSNHPALLVRQGPQLCQACHADIFVRGSAEGSTHIRRMYGFSNSTASARMIVGNNCANCHSQVHGSNHPSGANLLR